jgi:hypothetical protein
MKTPIEFESLPKFLMADDGADRNFVVHCHYPRFIMEFGDNGTGTPLWIDSPIFDPSEGEPALQGARLMREAGDFFYEQLFNTE